ncbi:hypothetical protein HDU78_009286 [Chytriomyces hyalinus]|nr:hypothetical protein HDU78_009286 [Chytriomyces hyalinus]
MDTVRHVWRRFQRGMREAIDGDGEKEGSLKPVVEMLTGSQMQGVLIALLPGLILYETGNMVVDMFVYSSLVTLIMAGIAILGSLIRAIINHESEDSNKETNLSVKVNFHRIDNWGEPQENIHYQALAWIICKRSTHQTKGDYRMMTYIPENDETSSDSDNEDAVSSSTTIPRFNILPRGDKELVITHNDASYIVQFDLNSSEETANNANTPPDKAVREINPLINREPPILIRRSDDQPCTLETMHATLTEITKLYVKEQSKKKRRARYERPRDCSYWSWVQNMRSTRGLASVALDQHQEQLLHRDLDTFAKDRDFYRRMGLPYRRGYLFSGKPGTGKTSLINAISATYNRDLYYVNLQEIQTDNELQSAFASVPKNSIIVFEDIDAQSGEVHSRERRFALKKVDRLRSFHEKRKERKQAKWEELAGKDSDDDSDNNDASGGESSDASGSDNNEDGNEEANQSTSQEQLLGDEMNEGLVVETQKKKSSKPKKTKKAPKKLVKTFQDITKDVDDDMLSDFGGGGFLNAFGPSVGFGPSAGGMGVGGGAGGAGGMDFGDLKLGKGNLFSGFTLSMLLNCLDGHMLNENIIIIMTSNHPEVLDPALIRPGRIDLHLSLGYCTHFQLNRMYQSVMDDPTASLDFKKYNVTQGVIAPCDALRIMILYRANPEVIPRRLQERAVELMNGKPLTSGIEAGDFDDTTVEEEKADAPVSKRSSAVEDKDEDSYDVDFELKESTKSDADDASEFSFRRKEASVEEEMRDDVSFGSLTDGLRRRPGRNLVEF